MRAGAADTEALNAKMGVVGATTAAAALCGVDVEASAGPGRTSETETDFKISKTLGLGVMSCTSATSLPLELDESLERLTADMGVVVNVKAVGVDAD